MKRLNKVKKNQFGLRNRILKANGYRSYQEYLLSDEWKYVRAIAKTRPQNKQCSVCRGMNNLEMHHVTYKLICTKDYVSQANKIKALCRKCHGDVHDRISGSLKTIVRNQRRKYIKLTNIIKPELIDKYKTNTKTF